MPSLTVQPRARIFHGHDWVYATEIKDRSGDPQPGDVVSLKDIRGRPLGSAIYNPRSQIAARRFSFRRQDLDLDFFKRRIERAVRHRESVGIAPALCRLVWSESDGLPGLVVDRYGSHLVLQTLTLAMDQRLPLIVQALVELLNPDGIVERNEAPVRQAEGMELRKGVVHGAVPSLLRFHPGGICLQADLLEGQKTGLYLDQLDNYQLAASFAKGRRVLDCFTNQGGFAQACALAGAVATTAVDSSEPAIALAKANAAESGASISFITANCFDFLKASEARGDTFDFIILDPPSFTKTKQSVNDALRGYKEIHLRALKMLQPGGILATFSCSHHIGQGEFHGMIVDASVDAKRTLRRRAVFSQRPDHPVIAGLPETQYLCGFAFEVMASW